MPWQSCANRGVAREVRIQASSPGTTRTVFGGGHVWVSPSLSCAGGYQFVPRRVYSRSLDPRQIIDHCDDAIAALHKCRAALHPVAAVVIHSRWATSVRTRRALRKRITVAFMWQNGWL